MTTKIKSYTLEKRIGAGGFGEVWQAKQDIINREVAIKVILPLHANHETFIQRFEYEAELIARLEHPHIVPLYDYWRDQDGAFLVMRFIRGGNLAEHIAEHGALDLEAAALLLDQIASALHIAHRNRIVHQDIKPANILLDQDGNAYLTDFGIARDIDRNMNLAEDQFNVVHGSPRYISPEHIRRSEVTPRSDIYSLGILMYEALTGMPPYDSSDLLDLLKQHVRGNMPRLQQHRPDLPESLNDPILHATRRDADDRYDDVLQMAREFRAVVNAILRGEEAPPPQPVSAAPAVPLEIFNPYKGLRAFQEADAAHFFGREQLIESLRQSLTAPHRYARFMAVVGPSGSGKSSVVRAGLMPALRAGKLENMPRVFIADMIPGNNPIRKLEGALLRVAFRADAEFMQALGKEDFDLHALLQRSLPPEGDMLLIIDQFEELFTLVTDEQVRRTFLRILQSALEAENSRLRLIVTMRADFLDRPLQYDGWGDLFRERLELVPPLKASELRDAILKPAMTANLAAEDVLVDTILDDLREEIGALPLLQYTLSELYERRDETRLTLLAYRQIGGVSGALAKRADEIFNQLSEPQRSAARLLLPRLVKIGENGIDTRRRATLDEIYSLPGDSAIYQSTIEAFGSYRLLTFDNDVNSRIPTVEIAHEAIIRSWHRLHGWIEDNREALRLQNRVSEEAGRWRAAAQDRSFLATGARLAGYRTILDHRAIILTDDERAFLLASIALQEAQERARRQRIALISGLAIVASIAAVIAAFFGYRASVERTEAQAARSVAESERDRADQNATISRSRELAASALLFTSDQPDRSMLLSLQALATTSTFEARNSLLTGLQSLNRLSGYLYGHSDDLRTVAISPDRSQIATGSRSGEIILWDAVTRQALHTLHAQQDRINSLAYSPDGGLLAAASSDGTILIVEPTSGDSVQTITLQSVEARAAVFAPDGQTLATADSAGSIELRDSRSGAVLATVTAHGGEMIYALTFSPDGALLASGAADSQIEIRDSRTLALLRTLSGHSNWVLDLAFSPDSLTLASGSADRSVRLWSLERGAALWAIESHRNWANSIAFSADGQQIVSGGQDGTIIIWNAAEGRVLDAFRSLAASPVRDLALLDGTMVLATDSHSAALLNRTPQNRLGSLLADLDEPLETVAMLTDGSSAASGGDASDFAIHRWDSAGVALSDLVLHTGTVTTLASDGLRLVSASVDRRVAVWQDGELLGTIEAADGVFSAALHADLLAFGLNNGTIELWRIAGDSADWTQLASQRLHSNRVQSLTFSPDGRLLASASRDNSVGLWNATDLTALHGLLQAHSDAVQAVAFSPDGSLLASASRDRSVILWQVASGTREEQALTGHDNWAMDVAFSPDGSLLASAGGDGRIVLWDVAQRRRLGIPISGHSDWVNSLAFSPDGALLLSASRDTTVMRWSASVTAWEATACAIATRPLDAEELRQYFSTEAPHAICAPAN